MIRFLLLLVFSLLSNPLAAQEQDTISGTYSDQANSTMLQIKKVGDEYHGMVQEISGAYAFQANLQNQQLKGFVFSNGVRAPFKATFNADHVVFEAGGQQVVYVKRYASHGLTNIDLRPYFNYSQTLDPSTTTSSPAASSLSKESVKGLAAQIAGGRLVYYTSSSILSGTNASAMTFMHFCKDGRFYITTDASFSVEGDYGGNAHGSSRGHQTGSWSVTEQNGQNVIILQYANGTRDISVLNEQRLSQGRWRQGNTRYAFEAGKAVCP